MPNVYIRHANFVKPDDKLSQDCAALIAATWELTAEDTCAVWAPYPPNALNAPMIEIEVEALPGEGTLRQDTAQELAEGLRKLAQAYAAKTGYQGTINAFVKLLAGEHYAC
ncbi:MAG: hypothetical protein JO126_08565 [Alphaproteobacteria bacterium]|nr:hypothetical protein [Alphaproteobacteria bacterium]